MKKYEEESVQDTYFNTLGASFGEKKNGDLAFSPGGYQTLFYRNLMKHEEQSNEAIRKHFGILIYVNNYYPTDKSSTPVSPGQIGPKS